MKTIIGGVSVPGYKAPTASGNPLNPFAKMTTKDRWESATGTSIDDMARIVAEQNRNKDDGGKAAYDKWANGMTAGNGLIFAGIAAGAVVVLSLIL